jgi:hypothetical protein
MSFCTASARISRRLARQVELPVAVLPAFLCPSFLRINPVAHPSTCRQYRHLHTAENSIGVGPKNWQLAKSLAVDITPMAGAKLPVQCPGCGALSQAIQPDEPGFYTLTRKSLRGQFPQKHSASNSEEVSVLEKSLSALEDSGEATDEQKDIAGEFNSALSSFISRCY